MAEKWKGPHAGGTMMWSGLIVYQPPQVWQHWSSQEHRATRTDLLAFPKPCLVKLSFSILETKLLALGHSGDKLHPNSTTRFFSSKLFRYLLLPILSVTVTGSYWHIFP